MEFSSHNNTTSALWSKKVLIPCGLALLAALGLVVILIWNQSDKKNAEASAKTSGPLLITPAQQHLGKLNQFEKKDFSFTIKNQGNEPLRIVKVEHSCGCTEAKADRDVIAPGETAQIIGSLNAENRVGEFGSQILVSYQSESQRDPEDQGVMQLKALVGAKAVTLINLPAHLDLGETILGQEPKTMTFEVTKGEAEVEWDGLKVQAGNLKSEVKSLGKDKWQVKVLAPKGEVVGSSRKDLVLELLNSNSSEAAVSKQILPVSWKTVSENFSISPSGIYLSGDRVAKVKIKSLKGKPVEISRVDIPQDVPVQVKQAKVDDQVHLEFQNFQSKGKLNNQVHWSGKIQLYLHDGFVKERCWVTIIK